MFGEAVCAQYFQNSCSFQRSICFIPDFGATMKDSRMSMTQDTALPATKQGAGIAV